MRQASTRIALDLGGTKIAAARIDAHKVVERRQIATPRDDVANQLIPVLLGLIADWLPETQGPIGIATTGFAQDGRVSAINPATFPFPPRFDLGGDLCRASQRQVVVLNDGQAAAWGEFVAGAGRGLASFAFLTVSTGVGGGLVSDGRLLTGPTGFAGHAGHVTIDRSGPLCGCGRPGCVETIASGSAISARASAILGRFCDTPEAIAAAAEDARLLHVITDAAQAVATLCQNLKALIDVERIVLGGSVGLNSAFRAAVDAANALAPVGFHVPIEPALCGMDAGLIGISALALDRIS